MPFGELAGVATALGADRSNFRLGRPKTLESKPVERLSTPTTGVSFCSRIGSMWDPTYPVPLLTNAQNFSRFWGIDRERDPTDCVVELDNR